LRLGQSFYFSNRDVDPHCWFVLSDPTKAAETVIANASTKHEGKPELTPIAVGEHRPPLGQPCYFRWDRLRIVDSAKLPELLKNRTISASRDMSPALLEKAQRGLLASDHAKNAAKRILETQGVTRIDRPGIAAT
jgi:hypothetical protein